MKGKDTRYSREFKIKAVELIISRGNITTVASELNITYENLQCWCKAYDADKFVEELPKRLSKQEEIFQLKRLLRDVIEERDIL